MYKKVAGLILSLALGLVVIPAGAAGLGEGKWVADGVYRATNYLGLTGLFVTDSAYTIGRHNLSISTGYLSETLAGTMINVAPVSITYGASDDVEFALAGQYVSNAVAGSGAGDTQLAWKWRFRRQTEYLPAMAMAVTAIAPGAPGLSQVTKYGARVNLLASSESQLTDTGYIGLYLDLEGDTIDPGTSTEENYYAGNFGVLFPISDDNRLQVIMESNLVSNRLAPVNNYTAATGGLRYTGNIFQYSLAGQALARKDGTNTSRLLFTLSAQF